MDGIAGAKTMASLNGESANTTGLKPTSLARGVEGDEVRQAAAASGPVCIIMKRLRVTTARHRKGRQDFRNR